MEILELVYGFFQAIGYLVILIIFFALATPYVIVREFLRLFRTKR